MKRLSIKLLAASLATTILFLLVSILACWPALADDKPVQRQSSTFSYTTFDVELPLVQVRMNDKVTGTFLIDTGSNFCILSETMVGKLGLAATPVAPNGTPLMMDGQQARVVTLTSMQIGSLTIGPVPFAVAKDRRISSFGFPLDGIVGANLLSLFSVFFDFPRHQITLWLPGGLAAKEIESAGFEHASVLPLSTPANDFKYSVAVQLQQEKQSVEENLMLDTGGGVTVISKKTARQLGLNSLSHAIQLSLQGNFAAARARLTTLRIGDIEVADKQVEYPSDDNSQALSTVGMDTLAGYRVLLDFPNKKMYIQAAVPFLNIKPAESIKPAGAKATPP